MPTNVTKAEFAEAVKKLNERISALVTRCNALEAAESVDSSGIAELKAEDARLRAELESLLDPAPPVEPPAPEGKLIAAADFSSPTYGGWYLDAMPGRVTQSGGWTRFEVRQGDKDPDTGKMRAELALSTHLDEEDDLWVHHVFRRGLDDSGVPNSYLLVEQFHEWDDIGQPAHGGMLGPDGRFYLGNKLHFWTGPIVAKGATVDLLYRIKLSQGSDGLVEPFWNGVVEPVYKGPTMLGPSVFPKAGLFRGSESTGTSVIEHRKFAIGTTKEIVLAA